MKLPQIGFFSPSGEAECGVPGLRSQDTLKIKFSVDPCFYDFEVKAVSILLDAIASLQLSIGCKSVRPQFGVFEVQSLIIFEILTQAVKAFKL